VDHLCNGQIHRGSQSGLLLAEGLLDDGILLQVSLAAAAGLQMSLHRCSLVGIQGARIQQGQERGKPGAI
jgi:hypothetical protein